MNKKDKLTNMIDNNHEQEDGDEDEQNMELKGSENAKLPWHSDL